MTEILSDKHLSFCVPPKNFKLVAGRYLVIDPCYIFQKSGDALWDRICDELFPNGKSLSELVMSVDNDKVYIFGTAHRDGCYPVEKDGEEIGTCGVDAGLLSFIPKEVIDGIENADDGLGVWVDVDDDAGVKYNEGDVTVDNIFIQTSYRNENYLNFLQE